MQSVYDVVILGAGINGVAIARELSEEGRSVCVIEKNHIAAGASSHSSRLIHGGLRYLEHFEFALVKEALHDQKYLLDTYPDLVKLRPFYLPVYKTSKRPLWLIALGLWLYGFFAQHEKKPSRIDKEAFLHTFKAIRKENLKAVYRYYDGKTDDEALTRRIAQEAQARGTEIFENSEVQSINVNDESIQVHSSKGMTQTKILINATGAWVDEVNAEFDLLSSYTIEKLSGIHLVIDRVLLPEPVLLETSSKRIFFIIPEEKTTLIGTTERSEDGKVDKIKVNNEDIEYLLQESNRYLKTELKRQDIQEVLIGTRPLIKSQKDPSKMSREYKLDLHHFGGSRVLHIYGGKLTSFPSLVKKVRSLLT